MKKSVVSSILIAFIIPCFAWRSNGGRRQVNLVQLRALSDYVRKNPRARVVVVTDLHDVALKRERGDIARFRALPWRLKWEFLKKIVPFGFRYVLYHCHLTQKPHIERDVLARFKPEQRRVLLPLLSPFAFDETMYGWYKRCPRPVVAFSNIGPESLEYVQQRFPQQMAVFSAVACAGPVVHYRQKHEERRYGDFAVFLQRKLKYKPQAVFFIDDSASCAGLFRVVFARAGIRAFTYQFKTAAEFVTDTRAYALSI